jgi:hypothetical protein
VDIFTSPDRNNELNKGAPLESQSPEHPKEATQAGPAPSAPAPSSGQEANPQADLKSVAEQEANIPLWKDFGYFLIHNKKWWLLPIIAILVLLGLLTALSSTAIAPFIYTVF